MKYCEKCLRLFEGEICPECGKRTGREPRAEDSCLLLSVGQIWADMACDILGQNEIPYLKQGRLGAGMAVLTGLPLETYCIYVPYREYEKARELTGILLPAPSGEEEQDFDFDPNEEHEDEKD